MKVTSKLMLSALVAAMSIPAASLAAEAKLYGSYTAGFVNTTDHKVDADEGLQESQSFSDFSANTYTTNKFGVNFKLDDSISGQVEAKIPSGEGQLTARKYFLTLALPQGASLTVGRHNTPFSDVAAAADNLTLGADGGRGGYVAAAGYPSRNEGITLKSPALGPVVLTGSLQKAKNPGGSKGEAGTATSDEVVKETSTPAFEVGATFEGKSSALGFGAGVVLHQEDVGVAYDKTESAQATAFNAWLGTDMFKLVGVYNSGDPLFTNIVDTAVFTEDMEDTLNQTALWGQVNVNPETVLAAYWGSEVGTHKATVKGADDIEDKVTTVGFNGTYTWKGVGFFGEYASSQRKKDGLTVDGKVEDNTELRNVDSFGVGVNFSWGE